MVFVNIEIKNMFKESVNKSIENCVSIKVWLCPGELMGHVSLQTQNIYVSIYPSGRGVGLFDRDGVMYRTKSLPEDMDKYEKKGYKFVEFKLYSLDVKKPPVSVSPQFYPRHSV